MRKSVSYLKQLQNDVDRIRSDMQYCYDQMEKEVWIVSSMTNEGVRIDKLETHDIAFKQVVLNTTKLNSLNREYKRAITKLREFFIG